MNQLVNALGRSSLRDDDSKHKTSEHSRRNRPNRLHTHHHSHGHHNKKKKNRNSGDVTLKQLTRALAQSSLGDNDDSKHEDGKKLTKKQRKKQKSRMSPGKLQVQNPLSVAATISGGQNGQSTTEGSRRRYSNRPLPFDGVCLSKVRGFRPFMNNNQIMDWLKSVFKPHIQNWYHECLSAPENQPHLEAAQANPYFFSRTVFEEAIDQHDSSELLGSLLEETDACPTAFHLEKKRNNSLTFVQHSAMVACLVVRDGHVGPKFSTHAGERKHHQAAAALLASVVMDLTTDLGYFLRLLLDVEEEGVSTSEDGQALVTMESEGEEDQGVESEASVKKVPRALRMSSEMFGSIGRALLDLQHSSDCEISFRKSPIFLEEYLAVLTGTTDQVREAEQATHTLADHSPLSGRLDVFSVPAEILDD